MSPAPWPTPDKTMRDLTHTRLRAVYHRLMTCPYEPPKIED
jgi:hypothetical protein